MAKKKKGGGWGVQAAIGGCLSAAAGVVGTGFMVLLGFGIIMKDTIANYMPDTFANTPIAFLFAPPQADSPIKTTDQYGCELNWNRDLTGKRIEYTVSCNAKTKMELRNLKVEVISPNEDDIFETGTIDEKKYPGPDTCKDKDPEGWPMDVPCYALDEEEGVLEQGTLLVDSPLHPDLGKFRRVRVTGEFRYPDDEGKPDKSDKYVLRIASGEGE